MSRISKMPDIVIPFLAVFGVLALLALAGCIGYLIGSALLIIE